MAELQYDFLKVLGFIKSYTDSNVFKKRFNQHNKELRVLIYNFNTD